MFNVWRLAPTADSSRVWKLEIVLGAEFKTLEEAKERVVLMSRTSPLILSCDALMDELANANTDADTYETMRDFCFLRSKFRLFRRFFAEKPSDKQVADILRANEATLWADVPMFTMEDD